MITCSEVDCDGRVKSRGMCSWHYTKHREADPSRPRCVDEKCDRGATIKGYCTKHYQRQKRGYVRPPSTCSAEGCERPRRALGWCMRHYDRMRHHGDLEALGDLGRCEICGIEIPKPKYGKRRFCPDCLYKNHRENQRRARWGYLLWEKYRIRESEYFKLLAQQGGVCAICGGPPKGQGEANGRYSVDHDHETGRVRGLLCSPCNSGIGHMKDSPELLLRAAKYLDENKEGVA
ncbi:endonuclease VII domain-containing protein [Microbacterium sp. MMO-23]|uniref:endonuclease VII domain-containing protein n=2 Tax=unclassified Microbacterium TaxID=2609290 RepID=UPI003FA525E9